MGSETKVVATGGLAQLIAAGSKYITAVDDLLKEKKGFEENGITPILPKFRSASTTTSFKSAEILSKPHAFLLTSRKRLI